MNKRKAYRHKQGFNGILMIVLGLLYVFFLNSCEEEFWPDLNEKDEGLLVVSGMITDAPPPYVVELSRSTSVQSPDWLPVENASVVIRDRSGNTEQLTETEPGIYSSSSDGMHGMNGHAYRLEIETADGKIYQSPYETLNPPVEIDTVYSVPETRPAGDLPHIVSGLQFYLDTKPAATDSNYLMWNLEATYQYKADLKIRLVFDGTLHPYYGFDSLETCWRTKTVPHIFTAQTVGLNQSVIKNFPLHYVSTESRELYIGYSLLVNQFTLDKDAWNYWDQVREQNEVQGGLYSQQPFQIRGNIINVNNTEEVVLGRFTVAGVSEMRIFVDKPYLPFYFSRCEVNQQDVERFSTIFTYPPHMWPVYATFSPSGAYALPSQACLDCRLSGGTTEKPSFWIDK